MPGKKYKLKCFHCGQKFKNKEEVFRVSSGYPICEICCSEFIDTDFNNSEQIIEELKARFNRNYNKFLNYLKKECKICPKCNTYVLKNDFVEDICEICFLESNR